MCAGDIIKPPCHVYEPLIELEERKAADSSVISYRNLDQLALVQNKNHNLKACNDNYQPISCSETDTYFETSVDVNIEVKSDLFHNPYSKNKLDKLPSSSNILCISVFSRKKQKEFVTFYCHRFITLFCNHVIPSSFRSNYLRRSWKNNFRDKIVPMLSLITQKEIETFGSISIKNKNPKRLKKPIRIFKNHKIDQNNSYLNNLIIYSKESTDNKGRNTSSKSANKNYGNYCNCPTNMEGHGDNKCERHLTSTLKRFKKSRKGIKERFKRDDEQNPLDSDHPNSGYHSGPKSKEQHGFTVARNPPLNTRRNSSPNLFCKNVMKSPVFVTRTSPNTNQGAIPKTYMSSEEHLNKKLKDVEGQQISNRSSQNTIKLIDKFLEESPYVAKSRKLKTSIERKLKTRSRSRSLSMEENYPLCVFSSDSDSHVKFDSAVEKTGDGCSSLLAQSFENRVGDNCKIEKTKNAPCDSTNKRNKSNLYLDIKKDSEEPCYFGNSKPSSSFVFVEHSHSPKPKFNEELFGSLSNKKVEGVTASFESMNLRPPKTIFGKESRQTSDLLHRLDNVLSELVEEEKRKIKEHEMFKSRKSPHKRKSIKIFQNSFKKENVNIPKSYPTPPDVIQRYKERFTEGKPHNPRILKNKIKSKLESMACYQRPRSKQSTKRSRQEKFDVKCSNESSYTSPVSDSDSLNDENEYINKASFEDEWSYFSSTSAASERDAANDKASQLEDEDDTCYGSDHISSDVVGEKDESRIKVYLPSKHVSKTHGDLSIDSAYTESRETTPDFNIANKFDIESGEQNVIVEPIENIRSPVQMINDARKYLLEKIKESQSYSDNNINKLLNYYSKKWSHIPEREMKIIVRSIRSDLGVRAPPKECIELLEQNFNSSNKGSSCQNLSDNKDLSLPLRKELSKEDILADLTATLPEYLKVYQETRKALSLSPSPELLSSHSAKDTRESIFKIPPSRKDNIERCTSTPPSFIDHKFILPPIEISDMDPPEESDEEWVKKIVGEETFREMELIINELKEKERVSETDPNDFAKMASELCERFSISF